MGTGGTTSSSSRDGGRRTGVLRHAARPWDSDLRGRLSDSTRKLQRSKLHKGRRYNPKWFTKCTQEPATQPPCADGYCDDPHIDPTIELTDRQKEARSDRVSLPQKPYGKLYTTADFRAAYSWWISRRGKRFAEAIMARMRARNYRIKASGFISKAKYYSHGRSKTRLIPVRPYEGSITNERPVSSDTGRDSGLILNRDWTNVGNWRDWYDQRSGYHDELRSSQQVERPPAYSAPPRNRISPIPIPTPSYPQAEI